MFKWTRNLSKLSVFLMTLSLLAGGMLFTASAHAQEEEATPEQTVEDAAANAADTAKGALDGIASGNWEEAMPLIEQYVIPAVFFLLILIVAYFVAKFMGRLAGKPVQAKVDETLGRFVAKLVFYVIMIGALLGALQYVGIGVASFAAVIAAAGFAVGLAFQGTLSNFSAGVMLLVFRPFKVGDVINAAGITAKVHEIDLFTTTFDTPDNRRYIVPNSSVFGGTIEVITFHDDRRVDVNVGVDYSASIDQTREVLSKAVESVGGYLEGEGRGYQIYLLDLGDSSVNWVIRTWYPKDDYWGKREEITRAAKVHLDEAGIGIPFPQMDIHVVDPVTVKND